MNINSRPSMTWDFCSIFTPGCRHKQYSLPDKISNINNYFFKIFVTGKNPHQDSSYSPLIFLIFFVLD
ncbi:MAG: hypothetical protein CL935_02890 [Deltaproteobacteria bacterium]|nr:hypothetical protein [Deltaproteobacteria bacterium]